MDGGCLCAVIERRRIERGSSLVFQTVVGLGLMSP